MDDGNLALVQSAWPGKVLATAAGLACGAVFMSVNIAAKDWNGLAIAAVSTVAGGAAGTMLKTGVIATAGQAGTRLAHTARRATNELSDRYVKRTDFVRRGVVNVVGEPVTTGLEALPGFLQNPAKRQNKVKYY